MATRESENRDPLLQGTLDLLILHILDVGQHHGHGIAMAIQGRSGNRLLVDHGSLYPALQRLERRGWVRGAWGTSDNNRRARFYTLTAAGRRQLSLETGRWHRLVASMALVMQPGPTPEET
jgi:PadR family transcriptional regulator, regulatory protein PadR